VISISGVLPISENKAACDAGCIVSSNERGARDAGR
jgi:hypothetical protein